MTERESLLILNAVDGLGNARIKKLMKFYGNAKEVLSLSSNKLRADQIVPEQVIANLIDFPQDKFLKSEYNLITGIGARVLTLFDEEYPLCLLEIPDAPVVLYIKGVLPLDHGQLIGMVGSRKASVYGLNIAGEFASKLADQGITVVSGLARGIDTAAHRGALSANGKTVAVLGSGLSKIYPPENKRIFDKIGEKGLLVSEFPIEKSPLPYNFPRRNRIISGLSAGIVVVEAAKRSGALITADFALEQGREVYAIPGPIDRMSASGVNHLIQQGAKLVTDVDDILEDLNEADGNFDEKQIELGKEREGSASQLTEPEERIYQYIQDRPVHIDELVAKSNENISIAHGILLQLELKNLVKQVPGKNFKRIN